MRLSFVHGKMRQSTPTFYGQMGEDKHIYSRYFPSLRGGTFLEMGALDGIKYSNTKFFEDSMGWSGVLIEPIPSAFEALRTNRPRCISYNVAVSKREGLLDIYNHGAVSSVKENTTEDFFEGWHKNNNIEIIKVPSKRLDTVLHDSGIKRIDFWSLDVEGSEYEALETMDWSIPVYLICIEKQNERKVICDSILRANGFVFIEELAHNEVWINPAHRRKY